MSRNTERDLCKTPETLFMNYPERFAQEALGHNSKAVHQASLLAYGVKPVG
jgi:hypothetical protein